MIILRTVKGKGISFAENVVTNHSMTISKDVLERERPRLPVVTSTPAVLVASQWLGMLVPSSFRLFSASRSKYPLSASAE